MRLIRFTTAVVTLAVLSVSVSATPVPAHASGVRSDDTEEAATNSLPSKGDQNTPGGPQLPQPDVIPVSDAIAALALADEWHTNFPSIATTLTAEAVEFRYPDGRFVTVAVQSDLMAIAVAPYLKGTHPCSIHSPSGCRGELPNREFEVTLTDRQSGEVISGIYRSQPNGFIALWLPRNREFLLNVSAFDMSAEGLVSTYADSPTCKTGFQLL